MDKLIDVIDLDEEDELIINQCLIQVYNIYINVWSTKL